MRAAPPLTVVLLLAFACGGPIAFADERPRHDQLPDDRVLYVAPGQSLTMLVRRLYPDEPAQWPEIAAWIVEHNPHAFVDGDASRMRADVRVRLPRASALAATDPYDLGAAGNAAASGDDNLGLQFGQRYVFVDPEQALTELVPRLYPEQSARWGEIIDAIVERNGDRLAELERDDAIARGTRLQIPTVVRPDSTDDSSGPDAGQPDATVVARVIARTGGVYATGLSGQERTLDAGDPIRRGDILRTGDEASAEIRFEDHERVFLRAGSRLRVHAWRLPETGPGTRVIELFEGAMRAITGAIGNRAEDTYRTITPQATLGVRGTEYALRLCGTDDCRVPEQDDGVLPQGLYLGVDAGRVVLLNESGETSVSAGEYRYVAGPAAEPTSPDADVSEVLFTEAEQSERAPATAVEPQAAVEDERSWWWVTLGVVLLGFAL